MVKIKLDKRKHKVIFECRTEKEMEYVLDIYIKGNEKIIEEARKSF